MSSLSDERRALVEALAGDPADFTTAPNLDAVKALPALVVEPAPASWIDGASESGPGRMVRATLSVHVVVNGQEPIGALGDLEECVERVLTRIPRSWRFDRAEGPQRVAASGGELTALSAALSLSMRYSID
jgi:hypothetical protein